MFKLIPLFEETENLHLPSITKNHQMYVRQILKIACFCHQYIMSEVSRGQLERSP